MFYEIAYQNRDHPRFIILRSSLASMFGDAWYNSYQNRFIVRAFDKERSRRTLEVINSMLQADLGLTFREISTDDASLSIEEKEWMQALLDKWVEIQEMISELKNR